VATGKAIGNYVQRYYHRHTANHAHGVDTRCCQAKPYTLITTMHAPDISGSPTVAVVTSVVDGATCVLQPRRPVQSRCTASESRQHTAGNMGRYGGHTQCTGILRHTVGSSSHSMRTNQHVASTQ
jgi:hypothetical protein